MSYNLFLDDYRDPKDVALYCRVGDIPLYIHREWVIVKNYEEFVAILMERGIPDMVSFDHDLAEEPQNHKEKTGLECARYLISLLAPAGEPFPFYRIHSMNPVGADNIENEIQNYERNKGRYAKLLKDENTKD